MSARNIENAALERAQLKESFSDVPVGLKLLGGPINPGKPSIFQMNIHRSPRFGEYFQIWPGAHNNEIEVLSFDRSFAQLVLRVKEPRRRFVEIVRKTPWRRVDAVEVHARSNGGRILKETRDDWRLEMWTPAVDRRYLCGRDDLHLFIAQVREGNTVPEARQSLKPELVRRVEALSPRAVQRQGEWFFVAPSGEESERLAGHLRERPGALLHGATLGNGSRPHVADFVVNIDRRTRTEHREYRRPEAYARGAVVHPDHRRLWLEVGEGSFATRRSQAQATDFVSGGSIEKPKSRRRLWVSLTKLENLEAAVALHFMWYNFGRVHQTLRVTQRGG